MKNFLDQWIEEKIQTEKGTLSREKIERYQLKKLMEVINYAQENSEFYKRKLRGEGEAEGEGAAEGENLNLNSCKGVLKTLKDMERIPFTTQEECRRFGGEMICVPQREISRIVTLETSGTTGDKKKIFFTEEDQELTVDFFNNGMKNLIDQNDALLVLMPCKAPGSVGDLLKIGVERIGAKVYAFGPIIKEKDLEKVLSLIREKNITSVVAIPTQLDKLIDYYHQKEREEDFEKIKLESILLSAEYVPKKLCEKAAKTFGATVFEHYGMTETGLGGAVSCGALEGYHPREGDLFFEIIDPKTGRVLKDGKWGEIVVTTLTRRAMPFIRYRTGDWGRFLEKPCVCGSKLKRLDKVKNREIKKGGEYNE